MNQRAPSQTQDIETFMCLLEGIELVIFDFDGVIADSEVISLATLKASLGDYGLNLTVEQTRATFLGTSLEDIVTYVGKRGTRDARGFQAHWEAALFERFRTDLEPVQSLTVILDLFDRLRIPHCIASSGTFRRIDVAMDAMRLKGRFDRVFSAEQVAHGKPEPDLFEFAAKEMDVRPKACLVIEDSPHGVRAAKAAGMRCVGFAGGSHVKALKSEHVDLLLKNGADMVLPSYDGLRSLPSMYSARIHLHRWQMQLRPIV